MRRVPHLLRDVVLLTLPAMGLFVWLWIAALGSFWNAEVRSFHGELVRDLRVGTLRTMIQTATRGLFHPEARRFLPIKRALSDNPAQGTPGLEIFDLRIDGAALDALEADLPASARERHKALLDVGPETLEVDASWRGQRMSNYFFARKSWKLRTKKREFVDGLRVLNLTPLDDRLQSLATFVAARALGVAAPQTRLVHLFVNLEDQGVYLLEEQVDESMIRRLGSMPGDVFYGELFVPDVPISSSWELFWNPYLWEKQDRWNKYSDEWRPWLSDLLDAVCDPAPAGLDRLHEQLDPSFARFYALLCFQGDQHVDHSHNWKLHFNLLSSRFEGIPWNPLTNMPDGAGVETTANRMFRRLAQDARFLDRVQRIVHDELLAADVTRLELEELDRVERVLRSAGLFEDGRLPGAVGAMRRKLQVRARTVREQHAVARAWFRQEAAADHGRAFSVFAMSAASFRLEGVELEGDARGVRLYEDRDSDGRLTRADRLLVTHAEGGRLVVDSGDALVHVGRDFSAAWRQRPAEGQDTFQQHREFTRLAALESRYLLLPAGEGGGATRPPAVKSIGLARTVGAGPVETRAGAPDRFVATETIHPWRLPPPPAARTVELSGVAELTQSLHLGERDVLRVAPGSRLLLGPGVSIRVKTPIDWRDVRVERLDPARPFGVIALQDHGCDGSVLQGCTIDGGSEATIGHTYYSGMFSAHQVDRLTVRDTRFANNVIGDDTVRLGACRGVRFERVRVENAIADAIDFDLCEGEIVDSSVHRSGNDAMDMMTGRVNLLRFEATGAGDKGISIGEGSHPEIVACVLRDCVTGIGIKDGSDPQVRDTLIEGCRTGVASYDKNWRYPGGGLGRLVNCTLRGNEVDVKLDAESRLTLEGCRTEGKYKLPGKLAPGAFVEIPPRAEPAVDQ